MNKRAQADGLHLGLFFLLVITVGACGFLGYMLYKGKNTQSNSFRDKAQQVQTTKDTTVNHYALIDFMPWSWAGCERMKPNDNIGKSGN